MKNIAEFRVALLEAGLGAHEHALLSLAKPSIRLRGVRPTESAPVLVTDLPGPAGAVAVGRDHCLALLTDGRVFAWGENRNGQLGTRTVGREARPVPVSGLRAPARAIAAGCFFSLALLEDGGVVAWGGNEHGELGDGGTERSDEPVRVRDLDEGVIAIAAGVGHSLALLADGSIRGWGFNASGQVGDGTTVDRHSPIPILRVGRASAIAASGAHSMAITDHGSVLAWGWNRQGQLGLGTNSDSQLVPALVSGLPRSVEMIAAGGAHSLALLDDGSVFAWGLNSLGQLGDATTSDRRRPGPVGGLQQRVVAVAAGGVYSLAVLQDGSVAGWGSAPLYLGGPTGRPQLTPVLLGGGFEVRALSTHPDAATCQTLGLRADGQIAVWGGQDAHVEQAAADALALGATKLGGRPDLPPNMTWPTFADRAQAFVAQVNLADLASLGADPVLPTEGLLTFFYDQYEPSERGGSTVVFTESGSPLERRAFPPTLPADSRFVPVKLIPAEEVSPPSAGVVQLAELGLTREEWDRYVDLLAIQYDVPEPIHKVLGHEDSLQESQIQALDLECASHGLREVSYYDLRVRALKSSAREWRLLLQIDSDPTVGGNLDSGARLYYWIRSSALSARRFDQARLIIQFS